MAPYKLKGMSQFLASSGPLDACLYKHEDGTKKPMLLPTVEHTDVITTVTAYLKSKYDSSVEAPDPEAVAKVRTSIAPVASLQLPGEENILMVQVQKPAFATVFGMLRLFRACQITVGKVWMATSSPEMESASFLIGGYGRLMLDMEDQLSRSDPFEGQTAPTTEKVQDAAAWPEGEDREIAKMFLPYVRSFATMIKQAKEFRVMVRRAGQAKAHSYLTSMIDEIYTLMDKEWRKWMGFHNKAERSLIQIKNRMTGQDNTRKVVQLKSKLDDLKVRIHEVAAASEFLDINPDVTTANGVEHSGRLYLAMVGVVAVLVIKKHQRCPGEQLSRELRGIARGLSEMRLWTRFMPSKKGSKEMQDDGREVVSEVLLVVIPLALWAPFFFPETSRIHFRIAR